MSKLFRSCILYYVLFWNFLFSHVYAFPFFSLLSLDSVEQTAVSFIEYQYVLSRCWLSFFLSSPPPRAFLVPPSRRRTTGRGATVRKAKERESACWVVHCRPPLSILYLRGNVADNGFSFGRRSETRCHKKRQADDGRTTMIDNVGSIKWPINRANVEGNAR